MIVFKQSFNKFYHLKHLYKSSVVTIGKRLLNSFKSIPGPITLPGIGTLYQYLPLLGKYRFDTLHLNGFKNHEVYGPIVREEIAPRVNIVWLFDPRDIEALFRQEGKYPMRRSHLALEKYRLDRPNVYNSGGLLPTNGPEWFRIRSIFQKGLSSPQAVKKFLNGTDQIVQEWLDIIASLSEKPDVDYLPELSRLFLEIMGKATLDVRFNSFSTQERKKYSRSSRLIKAALVTNSCILKLDNGPQLWRKFDTPMYRTLRKSQEYMEEVAIDLLTLKMSFFTEPLKSPTSTLLENYLASPELDFKDVIGVVGDFLLAGIDTTTYTTAFLLYHLAIKPDVQESLYKESIRLLPKVNSPVTEEVLQKASYAKAVLKESLRLRPISVGIGRVLQNEAKFAGYQVPEGMFFVSLCTVTLAVPQNYYPQQYPSKGTNVQNFVPIVSESNELNPDGTFSYSYSTGDGQQAQAQGFLKNPGNKETEAEVIQGSYSYTAPDGTPITVTYIADELGFRATGAHLPTPPPIPEAIQKALDLIARVQQKQPQGQSSYQSTNYESPNYQDQDRYQSQGGYQSNGYRGQYSKPRY